MSHHHLRKDPLCANCGHLVEERFCPNCGQENTETRQSFGHLVRHFIEDLTHYDSGFWRTMKYLLFRPGYLTKQFLAGKRNSFVPPVRLYFFVSFVAFLLPHLLPKDRSPETVHIFRESGHRLRTLGDKIDSLGNSEINKDVSAQAQPETEFKTVSQIDSFQNAAPKGKKLNPIIYKLQRQALFFEQNKDGNMAKQFVESVGHNFPKALFIYMPLFAFVIWLFHGKRRWLYFDHAILTVHYFSFIMLLYTLICIALVPFHLLGISGITNTARLCLLITMSIWVPYYFFRMHHKMYEERRAISILKAWPILLINNVLLMVVIMGLFVFALFSVH